MTTAYPDLSSLSNDSGIAGLLSVPTAQYPYTWLLIFAGIWCIITFTMYFKEKEKFGRAKILSSMAVACLAIIILSSLGTIIGIVSSEIMVYILVFSLMVIGIWIFSK